MMDHTNEPQPQHQMNLQRDNQQMLRTHVTHTKPWLFPVQQFHNATYLCGLYAANHGVTANEIYNRENGRLLKYSRELFMLKDDITPIWTLNELAGKKSAVSMWASAEFDFRGKSISYHERFDRKVHWKARIDNIIPLLKRNESQVNFVMFYIDVPDFPSHSFSMFSKQVTESLQDMDNMVKYLSEQLNEEELLHKTDIVLLSDHGMDTFYFNNESVDKNIINLYRTLSNDSCNMYGASPVFQVIANDGYNQTEICKRLKEGAAQNGNYKVYTDDELDENNWHIRNEQRFGPCTVVAEPGFVFQDLWVMLKKYTDYDSLTPDTRFGVHGYDNRAPSMQAVFMANGPSFRSGVGIPHMQNIDLYHLFARLLNIGELATNLNIDGVDRQDIWDQMLQKH
ncbi:ectonucleotide pyrophosphatase/phosphodiesterase family member 5-like isoform X2 [Contarinia nasturtii]|uniref:ectonucleotide pyrophosphatase/phosphodiesterase family member 5-like isoform X2 n=1 Tax=Contarinia nasturtii TaxID=265458 RepID=UPI0012D4B79A|nr:ectonucleotide pyrophosphatase/phosphodiesterase family member 5-like isoform X2 [Contarinia nasturtii]